MTEDPPLVVGIDLGTTNTVVAYAERGSTRVDVLPIPQWVTATSWEARPHLPSLLYAPIPSEISEDPWGDAPYCLGVHALRRSAEVPGRVVASSKSWLCFAGVDRTAPILPWGVDDPTMPKVSPLDAATRILRHVVCVWDRAFPDAPLAHQRVVLTVPASFDEVARQLTVRAAESAGLSVRLLEEPQAAFYEYMQAAGPSEMAALARRHGGVAHVLVCDVGGGTTDLSLLRIRDQPGALPVVERLAVGPHLLLGGDNMDLALAHHCESNKLEPGTRLEPSRFAQLVSACREAKERLLGRSPPSEVPITLLASGSKIVGGALRMVLTRKEVETIVLDGFFPAVGRDERPLRTRHALVAFGLPYERDAAITRHISAFFATQVPDGILPDAVLFNGGVFRAQRVVESVTRVLEGFTGQSVEVLPSPDPDLSVARGAVGHGLAQVGLGLRIEGGSARGYYVALASDKSRGGTSVPQGICVVPRGAQEGHPYLAERPALGLVVGSPVRFDLFVSADAATNAVGDVVSLDEERFLPLPPVAVRFERGEASPSSSSVEVFLQGELTPVGTLDLRLVERHPRAGRAPRTFALAFQLRGADSAPPPSLPRPSSRGPSSMPGMPGSQRPLSEGPASGERRGSRYPAAVGGAGPKTLEAARTRITEAFTEEDLEKAQRSAKDLVRDLEKILGERGAWSVFDARTLVDTVLGLRGVRRRTADHERVFFQLAGYLLRPGHGFAGDGERLRTFGGLFAEKVTHHEGPRVWQAFWIAYRRVSGGLPSTLQQSMRDALDPFVAPSDAGLKRSKKWKPDALDDMVEFLSNLERVDPGRRAQLGQWLVERTWVKSDARLWAAIGRIGARVPMAASAHHVVAPAIVEPWLERLLREKWESLPTAPYAAASLARFTGDRARDLRVELRSEVARRLERARAPESVCRLVREVVETDEADQALFYGEGLPPGLVLLGES